MNRLARVRLLVVLLFNDALSDNFVAADFFTKDVAPAAPASFGTIFHILPDAPPLFPPMERPTTDHTDFAGQISFFRHAANPFASPFQSPGDFPALPIKV